MTRDEFIKEWCAKSGVDPDVFDNGERVAAPCYCRGSICKGWRALLNDPVRIQEHTLTDGNPLRANSVE